MDRADYLFSKLAGTVESSKMLPATSGKKYMPSGFRGPGKEIANVTNKIIRALAGGKSRSSRKTFSKERSFSNVIKPVVKDAVKIIKQHPAASIAAATLLLAGGVGAPIYLSHRNKEK